MSTTQESPDLMLDPGVILADSNSRYSLKKIRIERLKDNILQVGGVLQNIVVEPLEEPVDGKTHRLVAGFYRHAAVEMANKEGAGLLLPAKVRATATDVEALRLQLAENMERENQSPMDRAVAIQMALDLGIPKPEVMQMFATPGGRKGLKMQPVSNSYINIHLSFLKLPKTIQSKIHDGRIAVTGAMEMVKIKEKAEKAGEDPAAKLKAVEEELEASRIAEIDADEKEEEKFLESAKKQEERDLKAQEATKELETAKAAEKAAGEKVLIAGTDLEAKTQAATDLYSKSKIAKGEDAKVAKEQWQAAETALKTAMKAEEDAKVEHGKLVKTLERLTGKVQKASDVAAERKKKLEEARAKSKQGPAKEEKPAAAAATAVKKAANKVGAGTGPVALTTREFKQSLEGLLLPSGMPKVTAIGKAILAHWAGETTDNQLVTALAVITGESAKVTKKASS